MTAAVLKRETLQTFRSLDFCSERELGHVVLYGDLADVPVVERAHGHHRHRYRSSGTPQSHPRA